ncbi:MAG: hypothetical protein Q9183_004104 [Haloplaca sp. 2 TL-2023]
MVRIPASSIARPDSQLPPYPITPTSPSRDSARNLASDTPEGAPWNSRPGFGNTPGMSDTERSGQVISHKGQDGLSPALRIGQETSTDHPEEQSDALRIVQSDLTPRSSLDSQRPGTPPHPAAASVDSTQPHPTNPFRRNPSPAPANLPSSPPTEDNTTAAWADPAFGANGRSPLQQSIGNSRAKSPAPRDRLSPSKRVPTFATFTSSIRNLPCLQANRSRILNSLKNLYHLHHLAKIPHEQIIKPQSYRHGMR